MTDEADALSEAASDMLAALKQIDAEMMAGFGSSFGQTREQVRRAIAKAEIAGVVAPRKAQKEQGR